ncbi:MAG: acyl-CoA dehydrogenase [Chloroflexi bacterium]|nr:acyl-CoA dehydrogenase [Chloroflexota bacterium]
MEDGANPRLCNLQTIAAETPAGITVRGRKGMVGHFDVADRFLVTAGNPPGPTGPDAILEKRLEILLRQITESAPGQTGPDAILLVLLDSSRKEIACRPLRLQSGELTADVDFRDAPADRDACMTCRWADWLRLVDRAKIALAAYCVGAARAALDMGVAYAKERVQFGKPIGSFQAIQHKLAEAACSTELAKIAVYQAAWLSDHQANCEGESAAAKLLAGEAVGKAALNSALTHGAYGFSMDNDIQFYFRRIKSLQHEIEGPETQKELIAASSGF